MKKQVKEIKIDYDLTQTEYGCIYGVDMSVKELIKNLIEAEKLGAENINIEAYNSYGSSYLEITLTKEREETNEEFNQRINELKRQEDIRKKRELEQLHKLELKYRNYKHYEINKRLF